MTTGFQGLQGPQGLQGRQGLIGQEGDIGLFSFQGFQGNQGVISQYGFLGFQGFVGNLTTVACVLAKTPQSVAQSTSYTAISYGVGTTLYDPNNFHDEVTNNTQIIPNIQGLYFVSGGTLQTGGAGGLKDIAIGKNSVPYVIYAENNRSGDNLSVGGSGGFVFEANGTTDYFELLVKHSAGGTLNWVNTRFSIHLLVAF